MLEKSLFTCLKTQEAERQGEKPPSKMIEVGSFDDDGDESSPNDDDNTSISVNKDNQSNFILADQRNQSEGGQEQSKNLSHHLNQRQKSLISCSTKAMKMTLTEPKFHFQTWQVSLRGHNAKQRNKISSWSVDRSSQQPLSHWVVKLMLMAT